MRGIYTASGANLTIANRATVTLLGIVPVSAGTQIKLKRAWISQAGSNTSTQYNAQISYQAAALPTMSAAAQITPHNLGDPASKYSGATTAAAGTIGLNASAENAGTKTIIIPDALNDLNGYIWVPKPEEEIVIPSGFASMVAIVLTTAVGTATSGWNVGLTYEEI